jgi:hypothetical protein
MGFAQDEMMIMVHFVVLIPSYEQKKLVTSKNANFCNRRRERAESLKLN